MDLKAARNMASEVLRKVVGNLGFIATGPLDFEKTVGTGAEAILRFPLRNDQRGFSALSCNVGIRLERIARVLGEEQSEGAGPTIAVPLHMTNEVGHFGEWYFSSRAELESMQNTIESELICGALPWVDRLSDPAYLRSRLESRTPADWLGQSSERRACLLAAMDVSSGDRVGAISRLDREIRERASAPPKLRYALEDLLQRVLSLG